MTKQERKTIDLCQPCHEQVRGWDYFPYYANRVGKCERCGNEELIARVRKDECDLTEEVTA